MSTAGSILMKYIHYSLLFLLLAFAGCDGQQNARKFVSVDITGAEFGKNFQLTDHTGQKRTLADYKGNLVVMFFGYTNCPDVCPTTMSEMNQVLALLGNDAKRVKVLFVTVDPARDTQALLSKYVPGFNPEFIGLYGTEAETAQISKDYRVFYQKSKPNASGNYSVDHSAGSYIYDTDGNLRLYVKYGESAANIAHDMQELLRK